MKIFVNCWKPWKLFVVDVSQRRKRNVPRESEASPPNHGFIEPGASLLKQISNFWTLLQRDPNLLQGNLTLLHEDLNLAVGIVRGRTHHIAAGFCIFLLIMIGIIRTAFGFSQIVELICTWRWPITETPDFSISTFNQCSSQERVWEIQHPSLVYRKLYCVFKSCAVLPS